MKKRRLTLLLPLLAVAADGLTAQTITGTIITQTGDAVGSAWVVLVDSLGSDRSAVLTNTDGRFLLRAPHSGTWVVRVSQLGYAERASEPLRLAAGESADVRLELTPRALPLDALRVEVERRCDIAPDEGSAAAVLWEEARKGLSAVRWTGRSALVAYRTRHYERLTDLTGRLLTQSERTGVSRGERPFTTPEPAALARDGFVQEADTTAFFYGPDAEVLLSESFARTHCFRARRGGRDEAGMVGLEFEPAPGHDVTDIRGTLWIDTLTSALRFVEFRYTGIDYGPRTRDLGGRIDFGRLASGAWIIERWRIRGPLTTRPPAANVNWRSSPPLVGFKEVGAELVEIFSQRAAVATPRAATGVGSAATPEGNRVVEPARRRLEAPLAALSEAVDAYVTDADPGGDVAALMRRGLDALRRYAEDRDRGDYVGALDSFVEARLSDRLAAAAWFGEGIAHAHGPELEIPDATGYQHRRVRMETAAELSARRAFVRAVELDPSRPGPAIELAALALATRKGSAIDTADAAIATVLDRAAADAELLTSASLVAAANGDAARAADLAERAVEAGGGSAALHALGSALVRIDGREEAGAAAYLRGIDEQDDTGARRYRDDARFIASPADLEAMNELTPGLRSFHLRALWERTAGERHDGGRAAGRPHAAVGYRAGPIPPAASAGRATVRCAMGGYRGDRCADRRTRHGIRPARPTG